MRNEPKASVRTDRPKRRKAAPPFLDPETLRFVESDDVAIYVASSDAACRPHTARAYGCRASPATSSLTTWVSRSAAADVLDDVACSARLAFTVSHIRTCRTLQLKSTDAEILAAQSADYARIVAHQDGFVRTTASLGYLETVMRSTIQARLADLVAIRFTPRAVFMQTPGPKAGSAIEGPGEARSV